MTNQDNKKITASYGELSEFPKMVFGVMGSAGGEVPESAREKIYDLGAEVGKRGYTLVTGIAPGLPHDSVLGAKSQGGLVIGISPAQSFTEHVERYNSPTRGYDIIVYTGSGLMGREVENIQTCDAVVIVGGRSGTLGEFAIAFDQAKIIGVLEGTGGIADHIDQLVEVINKDTGAKVIGHTDPIELVKLLEQAYIDDVLPGYLELVEGHETDGELE
ncbi:hypothetical protein [Candidatus Lucifugimonas marina]|jgi:uncharacterized protein (TIGR00725 family)|uniref:TIGR00725 family protein n=1 Tax=Candidatus Lucifugimonas marina TaxID=3038979 RepID=A0AAJ5ZF36_9CHLR|nr:hypothetical protein [SAR202 cluster bacterium JH702]MDG0869494.1 hypothetical protein [SAR202 cluster bacterium JH639]WFG34231.1 hypothetical protein GKN94_00560 [SAR202 cluster bacterium JH545]WFG38160.1 hypothetical protein GKO48_00570 [SAR202 cluster bacterium JH1073]